MAIRLTPGGVKHSIKWKKASVPVAAGINTTNCTSIDAIEAAVAGTVVQIGTITATGVVTFYGQESDDNSTFTNITGCTGAMAATDTNTTAVIMAHRPQFSKRYFRVSVVKSVENTVIDGATSFVICGKTEPVTQDATITVCVDENG